MKRILLLLAACCCLTFSASAQTRAWQWAFTLDPNADCIVTDMTAAPGGDFYLCGYFSGGVDFGGATLAAQAPAGYDLFVARYTPERELVWARQGGGTNESDFAAGLALSGDGALYVAGGFYQTARFGEETFEAEENNDMFLARYTTDGDLEWARHIPGESFDAAHRPAADAEGNVYFTGEFYGEADFGGIVLGDRGEVFGNAFLAKYDAAGASEWAVSAESQSQSRAFDLALDPAGENVYAAGLFSGTAVFGNFELTTGGISESFLAKFRAEDGSVAWARQTLGSGATVINQWSGVAVAGDRVYTCGQITETTDFGGFSLDVTGSLWSGAVAAYAAGDGAAQWAFPVSTGDFGTVSLRNIATDGDRLYYKGTYAPTAEAGGDALPETNDRNLIIGSLNAEGEHRWADFAAGLFYNGQGGDYGGLVALGEDEVYAAGGLGINGDATGRAAFGDMEVSTLAPRGMYWARYGVEDAGPLEVSVSPDAVLCRPQAAQLQAQSTPGGAAFRWEPAELLDDPASPTPTTRVLTETTTFTVTATLGQQEVTATVTLIVAPAAPYFRMLNKRDAAAGAENGVIVASAAGSLPPYAYQLNDQPFQNERVFRNLARGVYLVTARDANGCAVAGEVFVR